MSLSSRLFAAKVDVMTRAMSAYVDLAIKEAAGIIVADMNRRVPVDTGTLASTIAVERLGPMKYRIKAGGLKTTQGHYDYATGVSPTATFPYVRIGTDQSVAEAQDCAEESVEVFAQVDVFSRTQGKIEAKNIAGAIVRALKPENMSIESGYELQEFHHADTRFVDDPDGLSTHAIISFRALVETATG
jgi:hypothetical protein